MDNPLFDGIYEHMTSKHPEVFHSTRDEIAFINEYILPLLQKDKEAAMKMEAMFNAALESTSKNEFIFGFKTGLTLAFDCMDSKQQKPFCKT